MLQPRWINYLLWRSRFQQSSSFIISMESQLCLKIMLISRLKLRVIKTTLCSCNWMIKMAIENSLSNNSEHSYFERGYNQIQVLIQDQKINHPCDSALHIMTYKGQSVDFILQWTILQASSEVPSHLVRKIGEPWTFGLQFRLISGPDASWSPVLLLGTLNSELTVLSCLRIKTLRLAREVVGLAVDSSSVEHLPKVTVSAGMIL